MTSQYKTLGSDEVYVDRVSIRTVSYLDVQYTPTHDLRIISTRSLINEVKANISSWINMLKEVQGHPSVFLQILKQTLNVDVPFHDMESDCQFKWVIKKLKIDNKHRIETLPENINLGDLAKDLAYFSLPMFDGLSFSVVFNIFDQPRLINGELFSIERLHWLNMSGDSLNGMNFKTVIQAINLGKLKQLKGIVITGNTIKKHDLIRDIKSLKRGQLQYLETDHIIKDPSFEIVEVTKEFRMMGDAAKFNYLIKHECINFDTPNMIIDYGVCKSWYERGSTVNFGGGFYSYRIHKNADITPKPVNTFNLKSRSSVAPKVKIPSRRRTFLQKSVSK